MTNADFPITIYHNLDCGTSRNVLAMIRAAGYAPEVVEYLKVGWDSAEVRQLMLAAGLTPRELLRDKGTPAGELGLLEDGVSESRLIEAMAKHPILVNRPIVETPKGVKLCRPSEVVFQLLERRPQSFIKEDGEVVQP